MDQQEIKSAVSEQASQESVEKDVVLNIPEELVPSTSSSTTDRVVTCKQSNFYYKIFLIN